jgi:hypothetical protein
LRTYHKVRVLSRLSVRPKKTLEISMRIMVMGTGELADILAASLQHLGMK